MLKYLFTIPAVVLIVPGVLLMAAGARIISGKGAGGACLSAWTCGIKEAQRLYELQKPGD
jgi:uncharacterized membrane protein YjjP (DUF1212 family)